MIRFSCSIVLARPGRKSLICSSFCTRLLGIMFLSLLTSAAAFRIPSDASLKAITVLVMESERVLGSVLAISLV